MWILEVSSQKSVRLGGDKEAKPYVVVNEDTDYDGPGYVKMKLVLHRLFIDYMHPGTEGEYNIGLGVRAD